VPPNDTPPDTPSTPLASTIKRGMMLVVSEGVGSVSPGNTYPPEKVLSRYHFPKSSSSGIWT
jgi:hypothetical protein